MIVSGFVEIYQSLGYDITRSSPRSPRFGHDVKHLILKRRPHIQRREIISCQAFHLRHGQPPLIRPRPLAYTPVSLGGLRFDPERIGYVLMVTCATLAVVSRRMYACAMSLWWFAFLVLPLTIWAAAELNHPKPCQRAERGDDLALACHACPS